MGSKVEENVIELVVRLTGANVSQVFVETSLREDLGVDGDDAIELIQQFAIIFGVDISMFRYAEYFGSEAPMSISTIWNALFKKGSRFRKLTVGDLVDAALSGRLT